MKSEWQPHRTTCILARWRHYPRLKICVELQIFRPQGSAPLPPPRQYVGRYTNMAPTVNLLNIIEIH